MKITTVDVVIHSHRERLDWFPLIPKNWRIFLYNSLEGRTDFPETKIPVVKLPNGGREANGWLYHMATQHGNFADTTLFLQGEPFCHESHKLIRHFLYDEFVHPLCYVGSVPPVVGGMVIPPSGLILKCLQRGWQDLKVPNGMRFSCGAQHYVKREVLMARPADHYARIRENCFDKTIHSFGHTIESSWGCVYNWEPFCAKKV